MLNGSELAGFIKERQAKSVRGLRQSHGIAPRLAIIQAKDDPVIDTYVKLKQAYGRDIDVTVDIHRVKQAGVKALIQQLNKDQNVHGIIIQLPLEDISETDKLCDMVLSEKDVDALGVSAGFDPATPTAILWLLSGYNIDLIGKSILIIGKGKLVGKPLQKVLTKSGHSVQMADRETKNLSQLTKEADVIVTAAGSPAILFPDMLKEGAVVVDAGTASEDGKTVGDLSDEVYNRDDLVLTPKKGGVGPLTVCALFENVVLAARRTIK